MDVHSRNKDLVAGVRAAMAAFDLDTVRGALAAVCASDVLFRLAHPIGDTVGVDAYIDAAYAPLLGAIPDLERRDWIVMAGPDDHGNDWVGCGGHYVGTFAAPWLDIPPTGHFVHMRFHEYYRIAEGRIVEMQAIWDIPELMMQAGAWPLAPSLGREMFIPGPATCDGHVPSPHDGARAEASKAQIVDMLTHLKKHPSQGGPELMEMERFWHPAMTWYGPAGIGTGRGIKGFRDWHQIPFLAAMPDRGTYLDEITYHFFGDGAYCAVTGWPNMLQTITHPGWMGIAPSGKRVAMRSLDFWRIEDGLIRENWVMVDLLSMYDQIGVDPLARMREFNKARQGFDPQSGKAL